MKLKATFATLAIATLATSANANLSITAKFGRWDLITGTFTAKEVAGKPACAIMTHDEQKNVFGINALDGNPDKLGILFGKPEWNHHVPDGAHTDIAISIKGAHVAFAGTGVVRDGQLFLDVPAKEFLKPFASESELTVQMVDGSSTSFSLSGSSQAVAALHKCVASHPSVPSDGGAGSGADKPSDDGEQDI